MEAEIRVMQSHAKPHGLEPPEAEEARGRFSLGALGGSMALLTP